MGGAGRGGKGRRHLLAGEVGVEEGLDELVLLLKALLPRPGDEAVRCENAREGGEEEELDWVGSKGNSDCVL